MTQSLRMLMAELHKTVTLISQEQDDDNQYVWRDSNGEIFFWSPSPDRYQYRDVDTLAEADGISFLCPLCFERNHGHVGTHQVLVSFADRGVPDAAGSQGRGGPTRWQVSGTGIDDLVLTPSIQLHGGCEWHGFVGSSGIPPGHAG